MIVKEDLPRIRKLSIDGVLEIDWEDSTLDVTLSATHIVVTVRSFQTLLHSFSVYKLKCATKNCSCKFYPIFALVAFWIVPLVL